MLRTSTKNIVNRIQAFIMCNYTGAGDTFPEICADIIGHVKSETKYRANRNIYEYIELWLSSTPAVFACGRRLKAEPEKVLSAWLDNNATYSHDEAAEHVLHLLAREIMKGATK